MSTTDDAVRPSRSRVAAAAVVVLVAVVAAPTAHALQAFNHTFDVSSLATSGLLFALLGALVMVRQPHNTLGSVLAIIGVFSVLGALSEAVTTVDYTGRFELPGVVWAGWFGDWYWLPTIWLQFVGIPLLFPDGRPHGAGWRRYTIAAVVVGGTSVALAAFGRVVVLEGVQLGLSAESTVMVELDNPLALLPVGNFERDLEAMVLLLPLFALGAVASLVQRFRGASVDVRRQLKVVVTAIAVGVAGFALFAALDASQSSGVVDALELPLILLIPVGLGVAILRYRLYDIDRIVSRTVAWTTASLALVGLYLGVVVGLQAVLQPVLGSGDLPVALGTLAVAAVARPLLRRVQALVDQRFNRAQVDAARTIEAFGRSLRDEVSRDAIINGLQRVATDTLSPDGVGVVLVSRTPR